MVRESSRVSLVSFLVVLTRGTRLPGRTETRPTSRKRTRQKECSSGWPMGRSRRCRWLMKDIAWSASSRSAQPSRPCRVWSEEVWHERTGRLLEYVRRSNHASLRGALVPGGTGTAAWYHRGCTTWDSANPLSPLGSAGHRCSISRPDYSEPGL